ncbi:hypothetical protein [Amycolatopsis sp. NPDC004378]
MAPRLIVSSADGFVDTNGLTGWFPARNIYIDNSGAAVLGNDNRLKQTTRYDLQQVVVSTDRFREWLTKESAVAEKLARAAEDPQNISSAVTALENVVRGHPALAQAGPHQVETKVHSAYTATISDTPTVIGDHNRIDVRNEFKVRRVHVDLLDCLQRGWASPRSLVEALVEPDPGPKTAHLIREIGRSTRAVPSELLTMTQDYSVSSTTLCRLVDDVNVNGATTAMVGSGNATVNREFSRVARPSGRAIKNGLVELRTTIAGMWPPYSLSDFTDEGLDFPSPADPALPPPDEDPFSLLPEPTPPPPPDTSIRLPGFGL